MNQQIKSNQPIKRFRPPGQPKLTAKRPCHQSFNRTLPSTRPTNPPNASVGPSVRQCFRPFPPNALSSVVHSFKSPRRTRSIEPERPRRRKPRRRWQRPHPSKRKRICGVKNEGGSRRGWFWFLLVFCFVFGVCVFAVETLLPAFLPMRRCTHYY